MCQYVKRFAVLVDSRAGARYFSRTGVNGAGGKAKPQVTNLAKFCASQPHYVERRRKNLQRLFEPPDDLLLDVRVNFLVVDHLRD